MARPVSIQRETILEAARTTFMKHGYRAATAGIARAAGVSEGSLFKHFKTKPALFLAAMELQLGEQPWQERLEKEVGTGDLREMLLLAGDQLLQRIRLILPRIMMISSSGVTLPKPYQPPGEKPLLLRHVATLSRFFRREIAAGRLLIADPDIQAHAFVGALVHYAWCETLFKCPPASPARYVRSVVDVLLAGARPKTRRSKKKKEGAK